jgi:hypothetical protein
MLGVSALVNLFRLNFFMSQKHKSIGKRFKF